MPKRKSPGGDDLDGDETIPLPIQAFFWRQTSPFIRPKLGKLCDASCVSFERVVVQNIHHGLSPSLCEAIQSVSRWKLVQAAFPHVMHSCAALLHNRKLKDPDSKLGPSETKLLYTLHWTILDAASECEDNEPERIHVGGKLVSRTYMHSLNVIQLFVYLFAPLIHSLQDDDFQSLKLESGLRLWQPLWDYRLPCIPCFSTPVKPQRNVLKAQRNVMKFHTNAANIYIGKGSSTENIFLGIASSRNSVIDPSSPTAPIATMSDICPPISTASDGQSAAAFELICEMCNSTVVMRSGEIPTCACNRKDSLPNQRLTLPVDKDYMKQRLVSAMSTVAQAPTDAAPDVFSASYFDVAVLRCLFCLHWSEDGVHWALRYIHNRLLEICDEYHGLQYCRRERSKSLPIPDIQVTHLQPLSPVPPGLSKDAKIDDALDVAQPMMPLFEETSTSKIERPDSPHLSPTHSANTLEGRHQPPFKRIRVSELRQFFDSVPTVEHVEETRQTPPCENPQPEKPSSEHHVSNKSLKEDSSSSCTGSTLGIENDPDLPRPSSALAKIPSDRKELGVLSEDEAAVEANRRKSMPSLRTREQEDNESFGGSSQHSSRTSSGSQMDAAVPAQQNKSEPLTIKPIITITEDSPEPSPSQTMLLLPPRDSFTSQQSVTSSERTSNLTRSLTDSNIVYTGEDDVQEVSGSVHYIQSNGHLNYNVILKAVHFVSSNQRSARVCEVLLNIINCLLDLEVIRQPKKLKRVTKKKKKTESSNNEKPANTSKKPDIHSTNHKLALDSMLRIYISLGCSHGCGDGARGSHGDELRLKGQNCLHRLQRLNPEGFRQFFRDAINKPSLQNIVDFFHAFLGFCVDPNQAAAANSQSHSPQVHKKSASQEGLSRNGFHNNFGHSIGGVGYRGVEGVLISNILKPIVTKCVSSWKEISNHDNISLFCDIRQLLSYIKEIHGGTYRRVALSGLLDSSLKLKTRSQTETSQGRQSRKKFDTSPSFPKNFVKNVCVNTDHNEEKDGPKSPSYMDDPSFQKSRRSIFRKKRKPLIMQLGTASDSEVLEEALHSKLSPRTSLANNNNNTEEDPPSGPSTPKRRFSKFQMAWKRQTKSDHEDEVASDPPPASLLDRRESKSEGQFQRKRMSFKAASHATMTFLSARKRIEDGIKNLGKRMSKRGSTDGFNRRGSCDVGGQLGTEVVIVKEKRLVDRYLVKSGMLRFSFLLECSHPGTIPDPQLVAAMLDLEAPVVARAALLLECAQFIHRCNHGDWPNWMKLNLPSFRHSTAALQNRGQPSAYRRNLMIQRQAGRMFYSWAEALGYQLEYLLGKETTDRYAVLSDVKEESRKGLRTEDDDEDFLDEATVNPTGSDCPYALKMIACMVLLEVTTFLRETYHFLPKLKGQKKELLVDKSQPTRRWSAAVSSSGHSEKSSESNIAELPQSSVGSPGDRKISFAVYGQERSDSLNSSTTSLSLAEPGDMSKGRRMNQGRTKLLKHIRRGSGPNSSFRHNRSFKFKRQEGGSMKRFGSIKSRKVSSQSLRSEERSELDDHFDDAESTGMLSDEAQESPADGETDDLHQNMPWVKVVIQLANLSNFICHHEGFCHPNCSERQRRSCGRLITAVKQVYQATEEDTKIETDKHKSDNGRDFFKEKLKRRESIFQQASPTRRRESTPLLEKIKTDVSITKLKLHPPAKKEDKPKEPKEDHPIMKYIATQAQRLTQSTLAIITKAAPTLGEDSFVDIVPVAWELLLDVDQEIAASAATVFLLSSVKAPEKTHEMMTSQLQHTDTSQRVNAVLRFGVLWKFRYQVWPRMEDGAVGYFKVPPPGIDFTLPSPTIGLPTLAVVDPPWTPHFKAKIEEVTVNQEETKSLVTATTTRRKQQQEMIYKALLAEEERKRIGRENFPMTTISPTHQGAYEPALHHVSEDHEEAMQEELNLAARRVSLAPVNRANIQSRSLSWRNGSLHWGRVGLEGEEERAEHCHHMQLALSFFPSCICASILPIIHLLDDGDVNADGVAVSEVANRVIWNCIVEDPVLFLRHFNEKLTHRDRQEELLFLLRKLLLHYPELPAQIAHSLFNYLVGFIMFYVRTPSEGGQEAIGGALSLLWLVIPSVEGIYFKDLKQTLKKEQCDPYLMVSALVASTKKILIHGPDLSSIPSLLPVQEDTQFHQILQDSLEFFNIPEDQHNSHFLVDTKSNQMHNSNSYMRDFYYFRRNYYPQLSLVHMNPDDAAKALHKQAFILKFVETGKVMFTTQILQSTPAHQVQTHVAFLLEEFMKLPSFPRKALEAEFGLYGGEWGKELYGMDTLHKYVWVKLMRALFTSMSDTLTRSQDLPLFLNVINGTIILHSEDTALLRVCLGILINASKHFKHVFATNGYLYLVPTLLKVYSNNQPNTVLTKAITFVCKQFYLLHRKPFVLQMFGAVAPILDMNSHVTGMMNMNKVQPDCLFELLLALEQDIPDDLDVLDLVEGEKPLTALDFCYEDDCGSFTIMDVINMCVTVVAYAPDSSRAVQMLTVLEVVMPRYLQYLRRQTSRLDNPVAARNETSTISTLSVSMRALISACEVFTRSMSIPSRHLENVGPNIKPVQNHSNHSPQGCSVYYDDREESHARYMEEGRKKQFTHDQDDMETRNEFRKPRDALLTITVDFFVTCAPRLKELRRMMADPTFRPPELFDHKTHNRLAEIVNTLLKLAPYDPQTMRCSGLQRYMTEALPLTDWSQEPVRPALYVILRRLDRLFSKIAKKQNLRRQMDWEAAANILKGLYATLSKFTFVAHLPHLKTVINVLLSVILSTTGPAYPETGLQGSHRSDHSAPPTSDPPHNFSSAVVKLVAMQMQLLGEQYSLEYICGGLSVFPTFERCLNMMVNFVLPLCIRVGSARRDSPRIRPADIAFGLTILVNALNPPAKPPSHSNSSTKSGHHLSLNDHSRSNSISQSDKVYLKNASELVQQTAFLGLEIMMVCFDKQLAPEWHKVAKCVHEITRQNLGGLPMWKFLDFVVTYRPSIFLQLQPFIEFKMMRVNCDTAQEYFLQQTIKDKITGNLPHPRCNGSVLVQLAAELRLIKEEINSAGGVGVYGEYRPRTATMATDRSDHSQAFDHRQRLSVTSDINPPRPMLAAIGKRPSKSTILSQSSSSTGVPVKNLVRGSSVDTMGGSPLLNRQRSSKRIIARDGSRILEKFNRVQSVQEDDLAPLETANPESPVLSRQPSICFRKGFASSPVGVDGEEPPADILYENEDRPPPVRTVSGKSSKSTGADGEPRAHRLQRQDARSRKTFKIKPHKSKTKSVRGYMSRRGRLSGLELDDTAPNSREHSPARNFMEGVWNGNRQSLSRHDNHPPMARSVETIPETVEVKPSSRPRYVQRSKSHDDPSHDAQAPIGSARGRIARQGARIVRSRSPSTSPSRAAKSPAPSPVTSQTYVFRCESQESITTNENSALLHEEERKSQASLCIFFDGTEVQDTIV